MSNIDVQEIRERVQTLIVEIRQIHEQYKIEVPKKRRSWPKSIQDRILELWRLGVSSHQIALETGLPAQTLYSWQQRIKKSEPGFLQITSKSIKKRHRRSNFDLQLSQLEVKDKATTVTVITSDGLRVEGVPIESAADLIRRIGKL